MILKLFSLIFLVLFLNKCTSSSLDPSTYANNDEIKQTHIKLDLLIDFNRKILDGTVTISLTVLKNDVNKVILDINSLDIHSILKGDTRLKYSFDDLYSNTLGKGLIIYLDRKYKEKENVTITISYSTTSNGDAVQFLDPELTSDPSRNIPFMFTQCESISTRSLVPIQDTPSYKITVEAILTANKGFEVLFGGIKTKVVLNENDTKSHYFIQNVPIPPYLIAITAGDIVGKSIPFDNSDVTLKIWSEPSVIDCAFETFKYDLPIYVKHASEYMFSYEWGNYDMIVLPKSFPFGGMENPNLTFATPALLHCYKNEKGEVQVDRSQVFVAAHELAHSWTGNLVTNANWNNFWLNEGFTVFFERKINQIKNGNDIRLLESELAYPDMLDNVDDLISKGLKDLTKLKLNLGKRNPNYSFSSIPYEKGYSILYYLEQKVIEDESIFRDILVSYIKKFQYKSVVYSDFTNHFYSKIEEIYKNDQTRLSQIKEKLKFDDWLNEEGKPILIQNDYSSEASNDYKSEFNSFIKNGMFDNDLKEKFKNWNSLQKEGFLLLIKNSDNPLTISKDLIEYLRNDLDLKNENLYNMQIRFRWIQIELKNKKNTEIKSYLNTFLSKIGRQYFVRSIYNQWMRIDKNEAYNDFLINKKGYHPMVVNNIQGDFDDLKESSIKFLS